MNIQKIMTKVVSLMAVAILYVASTASVVANQNDAVILYLNDPLGSAIAAYDENGDVCWEETHTPYGDKTVMEDSFNRSSCGVIIEERGFTGHTDDHETDLVYMQQRYYDPTVGRFLSTDSIGPVVGMNKTINRYSYGANNPYKYVDPDGRFIKLGIAVAKIAVKRVIKGKNGSLRDISAEELVGTIDDVKTVFSPSSSLGGRALAILNLGIGTEFKTKKGGGIPSPDGGFTADLSKSNAKSRSGHRNAGNKQLNDQMNNDPSFRRDMEGLHGSDVFDRTSTSGSGRRNPANTEWDHNSTNPNSLDLRTTENHRLKTGAEGQDGGGWKRFHRD